ncbi:MAG: hypothetical protein ABJA82_16240 [Myxococcales bacterium]
MMMFVSSSQITGRRVAQCSPGLAGLSKDPKDLVCRFALPTATLGHEITQALLALLALHEMDLDVHVADMHAHGVVGVTLELRDRFLQRRRPLFLWHRHG